MSPAAVLAFFADDPILRMQQGIVVAVVFLLVYLLFYTLRDILLRTHSAWAQIGCIVLVAVLPIVGFLLYLLVRPARTIKERELEALLKAAAPDHV